jgi:ABC-type multidrug transport system ATPase subunit
MAGNSTFTAARSGKVAGKSARMLKLVRLFKFARMLRVLRYARFMQVAEYEVKKTASQMMDVEKEDLLRTKSSGRRESIVKRLSLLGGEYVEGSAVDVERTRITRRLSRRATMNSSLNEDGTNNDDEEMEMERKERGDAVAINNLVKVFERGGDLAPITATNDIGFGVRQGEIFSLLGPNGAGKSTVLNMMTGSVAPTSGEIYVLDKNISTQFDMIKSRIGFCPQFDALVALMNSYETLTMFARIKGIPEEDIAPLVNSLVNCIGLSRHADKMAFQYSGGNRRKLSVAIALLGNPDLVFLDEPSTGMDPASLTDVYSCVWMWTRSGKNRSIVLTTHSMEEADSLSNRIGILVNGKLAVLGTSQELKSSFGRNYTFEGTMGAGEDLSERVAKLKKIIVENVPGSTDDGSFEGRVRYELPQDNLKLHDMFRLLESKREELHIKDYTISQTTLEQVFIHFAQHQH